MRPLVLVMNAFGPYADSETIDFRELKDRTLFLITGPTGSGKTTILDGICFALYGDSSSAERSGKSMRSDFALPDKLTEIILDFEVRGQKYRIKRIPEQIRPKKIGTGMATQNSDAVLWKLNDDFTVSEGDSSVITGWSSVTSEVQRIIGFNSSQFRQVIMLPQGQFRKLLVANSEERQQILEKLFHTEVYRDIEKSLKDTSKKLKDDIRSLQISLDVNLQSTGTESIEMLENNIKINKETAKKLKDELKAKVLLYKEAQNKLNLAVEQNYKIEERDKAKIELDKLREQVQFYEKRKKDLSLARKAFTLNEKENVTRMLSIQKNEAENNYNKKLNEREETKVNLKVAEKKLQVENEKKDEREEAERKVLVLENLKEQVVSLDILKDTVDKLKRDINNHENSKKAVECELQDILKKLEDISSNYEASKELALKIDINKMLLSSAEKNLNMRKNYDLKFEQYKKVTKDYEKEYSKYSATLSEYEKCKEEYFSLQKLWSESQAAVLASNLEEGCPCPVCGSIHHPVPAKSSIEVPSEVQLKSKKQQLDAIESKKDILKAEIDKISLDKNTIEVSLNSIKDEFNENICKTVEILNEEVFDARKEFNASLEALKNVEKYEKIISDIKGKEENCKNSALNIENEIKALNDEYRKAEGAYREKENAIPQDVRTLEALNNAIVIARKYSDELRKNFETVRSQYEAGKNALTAAEALISTAEASKRDIYDKYIIEKNNFAESMKKAGFTRYSDYEGTKMDENSMEVLEEEIKSFEGNIKSAGDKYEMLYKAANGMIKQDIDALTDKVNGYEEQKDEVQKNYNILCEKVTRDEGVLIKSREIYEEMKKKEDKYSVAGMLSEVANGNNSYGMTFQRFVLASLLDDITVAATARLKIMSRGRYELSRTTERARKNAQSGLELEVMDNYTGISRPVTTLSGGESFLASLSLALGLADVVQSYSGGISLDTIFIDEGFGSLDPESLDFSLKTLVDLQQGGRVVGIISHMTELKERIDARLEIMATNHGSSACFKIT